MTGHIVRWLDQAATTRAMTFVAIGSLLASLWVGIRQYDLANCLADYNERTSISTSARSQVAADDRESTREIFDAFVRAMSQPPEDARLTVREALARWKARTEAAERERAQNPIPPPPSLACS